MFISLLAVEKVTHVLVRSKVSYFNEQMDLRTCNECYYRNAVKQAAIF